MQHVNFQETSVTDANFRLRFTLCQLKIRRKHTAASITMAHSWISCSRGIGKFSIRWNILAFMYWVYLVACIRSVCTARSVSALGTPYSLSRYGFTEKNRMRWQLHEQACVDSMEFDMNWSRPIRSHNITGDDDGRHYGNEMVHSLRLVIIGFCWQHRLVITLSHHLRLLHANAHCPVVFLAAFF